MTAKPRSREAAVGELQPIDVERGTIKDALRAVAAGVYQTHGCLETHIAEQTRHNAAQLLAMETANEKREEMFGALAELRGEVRGLVLALGLRQPE
ncbi:MAG: hypothetical protein JNK30_07130, partial [Phenylobacterium sp.]|uniref:hypothetical protein n=1 Tax=Phenylobacterium sp. TaxID=1871053 RepID=UPI001A3BFD9D